jgi:membrane-associated protease RseP (regulator of RpoE activity)
MSNDTDAVNDAGNDIDRQPSRFERVKVEVVSGGTQSTEAPPQADRSMMILGTVGWLALFVLLWILSPWKVVFVVGLAVSIMLHELGHFWTARKSGMRATQFFLGFGPRIWSTHRNGVEYGVRAIPLGGFVKIIGMTNVDDVPAEDEPHTYRQASYARRMWVITAGSAMHAIIAVVLITVVYATSGGYAESGRVTVQRVVAGSPADLAGLKTDDIVLSVGGTPVAKDKEVAAALTTAHVPGDRIDLSIIRDGTPLTLQATLGQNPNVPEGEVKAFLGISYTSIGLVPMSFGSAITQGPKDLVVGVGRATVAIAKVINPISVYGHLVGTNTDPTTRPGTIVGATNISSDVGEFDGWVGMLIFLANINLVVGVLNMFPLLPLDGGHAAIATYERLRSRGGKRYYADVNKLMPVAAICIALLAFMFLTGLYLDTVKG